MPPQGPQGWEPDTRRVGNWRSLFEQPQPHGTAAGSGTAAAQPLPPSQPEPQDAEEQPALDMADYRPWVLQRVRGRMPAMLHLRRYEPKAGRWMGWIMPYPGLYAVEYLGDNALTLDFGVRQFVVEGRGLSELARQIQDGTVLAVQEYAPGIWPPHPVGAIVSSIRKLGAPTGSLE